jgi:hypothetical protein
MAFSTKECAWAQTSIKLLGRTIIGIRGFEFQKEFEKEYVYGAGADPIDINNGNKGYPGSLTLLKFEVDQLNDAAIAAGYEDITEVPHEAVVISCVYKKNAADQARTITAMGVAFTNLTLAMQQAAKMTEVNLPLLAMKTTIR